jgi:hypothetical protein
MTVLLKYKFTVDGESKKNMQECAFVAEAKAHSCSYFASNQMIVWLWVGVIIEPVVGVIS